MDELEEKLSFWKQVIFQGSILVFVGVLSFILDPFSTAKTSFEGPFLEATLRVFQSKLVKYDHIQPTIYT